MLIFVRVWDSAHMLSGVVCNHRSGMMIRSFMVEPKFIKRVGPCHRIGCPGISVDIYLCAMHVNILQHINLIVFMQ